ncbi:hypothetical protein MKW92_021453 [Papaver armeniacum]|nr:hypothetical protein MKW92_021453 [Papaver armeniacum]
MTTIISNSFLSAFFLLILSSLNFVPLGVSNPPPTCGPVFPPDAVAIYAEDIHFLQFALNLEYLEAEYFLFGALGYGLDQVAQELAMGGPPPKGAKKANLDDLAKRIIEEFGYQEVGHLRVIKSTVGGYPRPLLDLSASNFAAIMDNAFGHHLEPPFDPYANSVNYMLSSYLIPYVGLTGYVGMNPFLNGYKIKRLLGGLLGVESGQDAVIRMYLYERSQELVHPYNYTVAEFTTQISKLRNNLGRCGIKDEGVIVPTNLGAENLTTSNVLSAMSDSKSYGRTPAEILRIVYGTGNEHVPGGFLPNGGDGKIARQLLVPPPYY